MHPHPHSPWQQPFARLSASCPLQTGRGSQCFLFIRKELYRYFLFRILDRNFCYERNSWPGHQIVLMKLKLMWVWRGYLGFMIFYLKQFIIYSLPVAPFDTNFFKSSFIYRFVAISGSLKSSSIAFMSLRCFDSFLRHSFYSKPVDPLYWHWIPVSSIVIISTSPSREEALIPTLNIAPCKFSKPFVCTPLCTLVDKRDDEK